MALSAAPRVRDKATACSISSGDDTAFFWSRSARARPSRSWYSFSVMIVLNVAGSLMRIPLAQGASGLDGQWTEAFAEHVGVPVAERPGDMNGAHRYAVVVADSGGQHDFAQQRFFFLRGIAIAARGVHFFPDVFTIYPGLGRNQRQFGVGDDLFDDLVGQRGHAGPPSRCHARRHAPSGQGRVETLALALHARGIHDGQVGVLGIEQAQSYALDGGS